MTGPGETWRERSDSTPPELESALRDPERRLGRYVILSTLGRGGMGIVYRAFDAELGRPVAIKMILDPSYAGDDQVQRFHREARAAAQLRHPGIVSVHEVGAHDGKPFLVLELIEGENLEKLLLRAPIHARRACEIVAEVAAALEHAHGNGVVHRDVKPENVIVDREGRPHLMDFGLALDVKAASRLTVEGDILGTPAYMAPEQAAGDVAAQGPRSDVYSLGAVLYRALVGKPPFEARSLPALLKHVLLDDPVSPRKQNPRVHPDLETITLKCLAKEPSRRYASAAAVREELERFLGGEPIVARPIGPVARAARFVLRHRKTAAAMLLLGALAVGAVAFSLARPLLEARKRERAVERAHAAMLARSDALAREAASSLENAEAKLARLSPDEPSTREIDESFERVARDLGQAASIRSDLAAIGRKAASPDEPPEERFREALARAESALGRPALLARAAFGLSRAFARSRKTAQAARERARAYRLDPQGEHGSRAFLDLALELEASGDVERALGVFRSLSGRKLPPPLRARAALGAGRTALALGRPDSARADLKRALAPGGLDAQAAAEGRWLETVSQKLAGVISVGMDGEVVCVHDFEGSWRSQIFVGSRNFGVSALRLDETGKRLVVAAQAAPEGQVMSLAVVKTARGDRLAVSTLLPRGPGQIQLYAFANGRFELDREHRFTLPVPDAVRAQILAVGDVDGDGADDILVFTCDRSYSRREVYLVTDPLGKNAGGRLFWKDGSDVLSAAILDLDGDGRNEVVLGSGPWNGYGAVILSRGAEVARKPLGLPLAMAAIRGAKPFVLVAADRNSGHDAAFGPDLSPDLPDAIWRVSLDGSTLAAERLLEFPFAERDRHALESIAVPDGLFPGYPGALLACESLEEPDRSATSRLVVSAGQKRPPLLMRIPRHMSALATGDLDGDGEPEVVLVGQGLLTVLGLKGAATEGREDIDVSDVGSEPGRLVVASDLLAIGHPREAALALEEAIASEATPPHERVRARLVLGRALAMLGPSALSRARSLCHQVAREEASLATEALLQAAAFAEENHAYEEALADLERLGEISHLSPDEAREVERRRRRIQPLASFREVLRLDGTT
ncbi:protein kinase, partial [bacterium]|nr:protein kinase [bacterium]